MNFILVRFLALTFVAAWMMTIPAVTHAENTPAIGANGGSSGHAVKHTSQHVASSRDIARISYPKAAIENGEVKNSDQADPLIQARSILLIRPRRFDRKGVYIWRDADGVWQLQTVSDSELAVTGRLEAEKAIIPETTQGIAVPGIALNGLKPGIAKAATIAVKGTVPDKATPVQFRVDGAFVNLDIQVDGKSDPSRIYLGWRGVNPATVPFQVDNRPMEVQESTAPTQAGASKPTAHKPIQSAATADPEGSREAASGGGSGAGFRQICLTHNE